MTTWYDLQAEAEQLRNPGRPLPIPPPERWPVMPDAAWHGPAGDAARQLGEHIEADPVAILVSLLVAYGNAVGPVPHVTIGVSAHPGRLFACLVGSTSKARKGTSWQAARALLDLSTGDWAKYRISTGLSSGEGLVAAVRDPDIGDSGMPVPNTGVADKRFMVIEEEFARVLQVTRRESSTLSAIVRSAYDTGDLSVLTKTQLRSTGAHISILGHITVEELRAKLTDTDIANGFANRFLYLLVRRPQLICWPDPIPAEIRNRLASRLAQALDQARKVRDITMAGTARQRWANIYQAMAADQPGGILGALTARPEAHTIRLATTYALLDGQPTISLDHLEAAWAVWTYSRASTEQIFHEPAQPTTKEAKKLLAAIQAAGSAGLSFEAQTRVFHGHIASRDLERARLELDDLVVTVTEPTRGRPRWVTYLRTEYNPGGESPDP